MQIVPFDQWTDLGQWFPTLSWSGPAAALVAHHSVTNPTGNSFADVRTVERVIYQRRIKSRFAMIAYSYLIHPDGTVFEGRGVRKRNGANNRTKPGTLSNGNTLSVCLIGTYTTAPATHQQADAFAGLAEHLEQNGYLTNRRNVVPHSALAATVCCGDGGRQLIADYLTTPEPAPTPIDLTEGTPPMDLIYDPEAERLFVIHTTSGTTKAREYSVVTPERVAAARHLPGVARVIDEREMRS